MMTSLFAGAAAVSADAVQPGIQHPSITITAGSAGKVYDGTPLTDSSYSITSGSLADGDTLVSADVIGEQTEAGLGMNLVSDAVIMNGDEDVTSKYSISYGTGALTVDQASVTIAADSASKVYDGTALTGAGYTVSEGSFFGNDGLTSVTVEGSQTDAGSCASEITSYTFNDSTNPSNYNVQTVGGTLTVEKASVTVTAGSSSKTDDGTALTDAGYTVSGLAAGDTLTAATSGSQSGAGSSVNTISSCTISRDGQDVTGSYNITTVNGTLTVNAAPAPAPTTDENNTDANEENTSADNTAASAKTSSSSSSNSSKSSESTAASAGTAASENTAASSQSTTASTAAADTQSTADTQSAAAVSTDSSAADSSVTTDSSADSNAADVQTAAGTDDSNASEVSGYSLTAVGGDESVPLASGADTTAKVRTEVVVIALLIAAAAILLGYILITKKHRSEIKNLCNEIKYDEIDKDSKE